LSALALFERTTRVSRSGCHPSFVRRGAFAGWFIGVLMASRVKSFLKRGYDAVPLKKEIFSVLKKVWHPGEKIYRHLHFKGVFDVAVDDGTSFKLKHHGFLIENEIFWDGLEKGLEKVSYGLWTKMAREADVIFDIGANTGIYSLIANSVNPKAKIYAFEPVKRIFEKLEENRRLNNFDFVSVEEGLSNYDGDAVIFDPGTEHLYSVTVNQNFYAGDVRVNETKIAVERLDTFIERNGLAKVDLMKIDVETHEPEVLEGMGKYLEDFRPSILIEILEDEVGKKVERLVEKIGYLYFNIDDGKGTLRQVEHISKSDFWNYLLCSPKAARELGLVA
jgi:FkbM family methyltransferase